MGGVTKHGEGAAGVRPGRHGGADAETPFVDALAESEEFGDTDS